MNHEDKMCSLKSYLKNKTQLKNALADLGMVIASIIGIALLIKITGAILTLLGGDRYLNTLIAVTAVIIVLTYYSKFCGRKDNTHILTDKDEQQKKQKTEESTPQEQDDVK